ncbi:hypothetical protein, partial [Chroococcidiopsis sp.]|uniref:hypothetical protein n=1 Tax=Chroococcidiopsis sp. TaxID=3088168 RepID=UPI003F2F341E
MNSMNHSGHSMVGIRAIAQAELAALTDITPNIPVSFAIDIRDESGKAIPSFDIFHEKLMHLIVVSDDLQFFNHIHPTYKQNGHFEVTASFPQPGRYTLLSDYKPTSQTEQVSLLRTQISGESSPTPPIELDCIKTFADTKVELTSSESILKAGQEVTLMLKLQQADSNQLVVDLQPYLGELGHLVIFRRSSLLTASDYIHAHALKGVPKSEVHFITQFPQPGEYKLWAQFNRNGKIVTADFWVNVA